MKANKVYLSRLKRGFKDKKVIPYESNVIYDICGCKYWNDKQLDTKIMMKMCDYHRQSKIIHQSLS